MAICKHNTSKNGFAAPLDYLTLQHGKNGCLLLDEEGIPLPREEYIIDGISCLPETFGPLCLQDRLHFGKAVGKNTVDTHQYILSFAPSDVAKGLTMEKAHDFALAFAQKNFPGHRVLVCTHPDGEHQSGNIHVHIVISNLRFRDRPPEPQFMRLRPDGSVKPSEYLAGYSHQDTPVLRKHLLSQVNAYCASQGYRVCPEKAAVKVSQNEYYLKSRGQETWNDQLRRAIADAAATTDSWEEFTEKLRYGYTHTVCSLPPIPRQELRKLWATYKDLNGSFWAWDNQLRASLREQLNDAFEKLKTCKTRYHKAAVRETIAQLKQDQAKERLFRQTWQAYAKAASLALKSQNRDDAMLCLEQLQELAKQHSEGWQEGWNTEAVSHSLLDGSIKSKASWKHISGHDLEIAEKILQAVQEEARQRQALSSQTREVPMPIEVKLTRGVVSFRHPDSEYWVRGSRLGDAFTLPALGIAPPVSRSRHQPRRTYSQDYER